MNAKLKQTHSDTSNELDVIAVSHNRVLIIECKAGRQDKAQESLYKLAQVVKQIGGLMARGLYVSARALNEADSRRAKEYGLDVLAADDLSKLPKYLNDWVSNSSVKV